MLASERFGRKRVQLRDRPRRRRPRFCTAARIEHDDEDEHDYGLKRVQLLDRPRPRRDRGRVRVANGRMRTSEGAGVDRLVSRRDHRGVEVSPRTTTSAEIEHDDDEEDLRRRTPRPESSEWAKIPLLFIKEARPPGTAMRVGIGRSGLVDPEVLFRF